jgi:pimeloyl-ACP methyl ester carboxylesterase
MSQPVDEWIEVAAGVRLRVRRWAGPDTTPFLLVHGLSSNACLWDEVAGHLDGHPVYAVDLRSHGESDAPPDGYDTATAAEDLATIIRALGLRAPVVAGQSWGGNVVVRLAARHPDLVAALALVDGGWIDLSADFDSWAACEAALRPPDVDGLRPEWLHNYLHTEHPDWSAAAIAATVANLRVRADGTLERRLPITEHLRIVRSMWDDPPAPDYPAIAVPVLLLPAVPAEAAGAQRRRERVGKAAAALANARVREYVGADHDIHAQHPAELAADLLTLAEAA